MSYYDRYRDVSELKGKTLSSIENRGDELVFTTTEGEVYRMYHEQDCCESVYIEDIVGDLEDLVGSEILRAEESMDLFDVIRDSEKEPEHTDESFTWTFYKFATRKGYVDIRWYGTSNGYYSESVSFIKDQHD